MTDIVPQYDSCEKNTIPSLGVISPFPCKRLKNDKISPNEGIARHSFFFTLPCVVQGTYCVRLRESAPATEA